MKLNNKSQIALIAVFLISSTFLVLYSIETQSYYNTKNTKYDIQSVVEIQFCEHISISNGSVLNNSLNFFENEIHKYCLLMGSSCSLDITVLPTLPGGNISLLNKTYLALNYTLISNDLEIKNYITC